MVLRSPKAAVVALGTGALVAGVFLPVGVAYAGELLQPGNALALDITLIIAVAFGMIHLLGPQIRRRLQAKDALVRAFGGGMALAYAFLLLLPELEITHAVIGDAIHFIVLAGVVMFYGLEVGLQSYWVPERSRRYLLIFWVHIAIGWVYNWMVIYGMPAQVAIGPGHAIITGVAVGLHFIYKDYLLSLHQSREYDSWGRYVLATAPLAGWPTDVFVAPSEMVFDLVLAVLVGYLLQNVFRNELSDTLGANFSWLLAGVVTYALLVGIVEAPI